MTTTMLLYIVMGIGAGFCVAAALGAKFLLPSPKESINKTQDSEQPKQRDGKNPAAPTESGINLNSSMSNSGAGSPVPENVRDQLVVANQVWSQMMRLMPSAEWRKVKEASNILDYVRLTQDTLDLAIPREDYMQLVVKTRPEAMEDLFRSAGRLSRSA